MKKVRKKTRKESPTESPTESPERNPREDKPTNAVAARVARTGCVSSLTGKTQLRKPFGSWWKSNRPATTSRRWTAWARFWPGGSKDLAAIRSFIAPRISATTCRWTFATERSGKPVLLLGHLDTVYPLGTLAGMPCRVADGRLSGPGALDMKSGIALMLHAIDGLRTWHSDTLPRPVTVLLVSDEEVGSESSRPITESLARRSAAVLVLEPSYGVEGCGEDRAQGRRANTPSRSPERPRTPG